MSGRNPLCLVATLAALALFSSPLAAQEAPTVILSMGGNWRAFHVLNGPYVRDGEKLERRGTEVETLPPPADWRAADFDDSAWCRLRGMPCQPNAYGAACAKANAGFAYLDGGSAWQSLLCLRGKFNVADPAKAKDLSLFVEYRGGAVVYLNGKEIARSHMPAGEVTPDTLAGDYPVETFLDPDGSLQKENWREKDENVIAAWKRIKRTLEAKVPANALRKGVNVLAVEIHRAAYPKGYEERIAKNTGYGSYQFLRSTCGITDLALTSPDASVVEPNVDRPAGVQVWNSSIDEEDPYDWGDPLEPLRPLEIVACLNGSFSGEVSVGSRETLVKPTATISDLVDAKTKSTIPASSVVIRYAHSEQAPDEVKAVRESDFRAWTYAAGFRQGGGATLPVRVTVSVPKDAKPGVYEGTLALGAEGVEARSVPVRVEVVEFALPDPKDFETVVDMIESPDTLALHYDVPLWSEEHWKLVDRSFEVLGCVGLDTIYLPLIAETHFGNEQSMVRWIRKPDGTYDHDFSILERYLDTFEKHCGKPRYVALYVWCLSLEGGSTWVNKTNGMMTDDDIKFRQEYAKQGLGPVVTALDPATGKCERLQLPQYSEEGSVALWKPLGARLRALLEKRGVADAAMLGIPLDPKPTEGVVNLWKEVLPGTPWLVQDHLYVAGEKIHGVPAVYQANVFIHDFAKHDVEKSMYGTKHPELRLRFPRGLGPGSVPFNYRLLPEKLMMTGLRGIGRVAADVWPVLPKGRRGRAQQVTKRYPQANAGGLSVWGWMLDAGDEGACLPMRTQLLLEGVEETEARIVIERALIDGKLSGDLADRAKALLRERNLTTLIGSTGKIREAHHIQWWEHTQCYGYPGYAKAGAQWYLASNRPARARRLFAMAEEVRRVLKGE